MTQNLLLYLLKELVQINGSKTSHELSDTLTHKQNTNQTKPLVAQICIMVVIGKN